MSHSQTASAASPAQPITLVSGLMLLALVIVTVAGWIALGGLLLGVKSFFASFLFLWYWAAVEKAEFDRLAPALIGAMVGVALAWQTRFLTTHDPQHGLILALVVICIALFVQIMDWAPLAVNAATMLFLTVLGAPALLGAADFVELTKAVVLGAAFFAMAVYLAKVYVAARARARAQAPSATASGHA